MGTTNSQSKEKCYMTISITKNTGKEERKLNRYRA